MSSGVLGGVLSAVRSWPGVVEGKSRFGGPGLAFRANGREFLHVHTPTRIDVRVTKAHAKTLRGDPRAVLRRKPSDWVELIVEDAAGAAHAVKIARGAWREAKKPARR